LKGFAKEAQRLGFIVIGNAIIALGFCCFINPNGFLAGGIYGLAGILRYFAPSVPFPLAVLLFNIPCIIWGYIELRRAFILRSAVGIVAQTIFLAIFPSFVPTYTNDPLLSAIVGGVVAGAGIGIAMRCFSATGGMDIAAMIMKKKFSTSVGTMSTAFNLSILAVSTIFFGLEKGLYTMIYTFLSGKVINMVLEGISRKKSAFIVTSQGEAMGKRLIQLLGRGVTIIPVKGAYTQEEKSMLFCVVNQLEISPLKAIVQEIDPSAFVTIYETAEVKGSFSYHHAIVDTNDESH
jgi:uncharacterized membrane-anchored protein YitT (DUF2179 family)